MMIFSEVNFQKQIEKAGIDPKTVTITVTPDNNYVHGGAFVRCISPNVNISFTGSKFPQVCSSGMVYSYSVNRSYLPGVRYENVRHEFNNGDRKEATVLIEALLSNFGDDSYPIVGGWIAANPIIDMMSENHFLVLGGFIPLMSWANSYHAKRGTVVWLKQCAIPANDRNDFIDETQRDLLYQDKKTIVSLFREKSVETAPKIKPIKVKEAPVRFKDSKGRFQRKPVYNWALMEDLQTKT